MYLQETTEQRALRTTLRDYFRGLMTPDVIRALRDDGESGPARRRVLRQMGSDGVVDQIQSQTAPLSAIPQPIELPQRFYTLFKDTVAALLFNIFLGVAG